MFVTLNVVFSLVPKPPQYFVLQFAFSVIHRSRRVVKNREGLHENTYHVNDELNTNLKKGLRTKLVLIHMASEAINLKLHCFYWSGSQ